MSHETAEALWGVEVVRRALNEVAREPPSEALAHLVHTKACELRDDVAFAQWALTLPWATFCAVVRIVAGNTRKELLGE